ncbi:MAG: 2-amino-4-ketopentanoate thiolase [Tissierellia bacterium]|nr:2-amino-4-ketopentanoate thiolase [Tissierellia bacterium]
MFEKNTWVRIHSVVLKPEERAGNIPDNTKEVPLEFWTKGYLLEDGELGELVKVRTKAGRIVEGNLVEVNPQYQLDYGKLVPELLRVGEDARGVLREDK